MRTENDLRTALDELASEATDAATFQLKQPSRRKPVVRIAIAVVATACAAVAVPLLLDRDKPPAPAPAPTVSTPTIAKPVGWHPISYALPGWQVAQRDFTTRTAFASVMRTDGIGCGTTAFSPGDFDPAEIEEPKQAITVAGKAGFSGVYFTARGKRRGVFWQYDANAWAVLHCGPNQSDPKAPAEVLGSPRDSLNRQVAASVTIDQQRAATGPARFGYLPAGFKPVRVSRGVAGLRISGERLNPLAAERIELSLDWPPSDSSGQPVTVNGRPGRIDEGRLEVDLGGGRGYIITFYETRFGAKNKAELLKIAKGLRVADVQDDSTWFAMDLGLQP